MPRAFTLTWQMGNAKRTGRWRKKYQGKIYYFSGGRGKTDRVAYDAAVKTWNELKLQIDASAPKPHQAEHENAIYIWEEVLNWCRKNQETEMANMAIAKLAILRRSLSAPSPNPVRVDDTFGGQFELAARDPDWHALHRRIGDQVEQFSKQPVQINSDDPFFNRISATSQLIDPTTLNQGLDFVDPLKLERKVWDDRLNVMRRLKVSTDQTLKAYVDKFLILKKALADAGELIESRVYSLRTHLTHFMEWLGSESSPAIVAVGNEHVYSITLNCRLSASQMLPC